MSHGVRITNSGVARIFQQGDGQRDIFENLGIKMAFFCVH